MPRLPRVTGPEVRKALERAGWSKVHQEGSHVQMKHPSRPGRVTVPVHRGETLPVRTLSSILKQAGMTAEELIELL